MHDRDDVAGNGEAAQRDMRARGNGPDHLAHGFDFASHDLMLNPFGRASWPHAPLLEAKKGSGKIGRNRPSGVKFPCAWGLRACGPATVKVNTASHSGRSIWQTKKSRAAIFSKRPAWRARRAPRWRRA